MKPNFLLLTALVILMFSGSSLANVGSDSDSDLLAEDMYTEYMKLGRNTFSMCHYDSVSIYTDLAIAYTTSEPLKQKARRLYDDAMTCKTKRNEGNECMTKAMYSQAFECFAVVIKLNPKDEYCRSGYSRSYKFQHKTIESFDMVSLPGGNVTIGRNDGAFNEGPAHKFMVSPFAMSKYEISVSQFCIFLNACTNTTAKGHKCMDVDSPYSHVRNEDGWYIPERGFENYPATCVSYYGAEAFCHWIGYQLMTEEQFEYAFANSQKSDSPDGPMPVKAGVANKYGIHNLNGNVAEWTRDYYNPARYKKRSESNKTQILETITVRGGSFDSAADINPKTFRDNDPQETYLYNVGFRCVYEY